MEAGEIERRIESAFDDATVVVTDATGTGDHFDARVIAASFEGRSAVERHQMIYRLFAKELASQELHALALKTLAPSEA